jgi:branched-chain amino acid transport system ATP-binding protein
LRRLNRETGLSILVAEQNAAIALKYADRATILENGITVLSGEAAKLGERDDVKTFYLGQKIIPGAPGVPAQHAAAV